MPPHYTTWQRPGWLTSFLVFLQLAAGTAAAQQETRAYPEALEHTNKTVFVNAPSPRGADRQQLERIVIFSAIVYSADEVSPEKIDSKYGLSKKPIWVANRTEARRALIAKVAGLDRALKVRCAAHLQKHIYWSTVYHAYVLESFGPAPGFEPTGRFYSTHSLRIRQSVQELAALLAEVYRAGGGDRGWRPMVDMMAKYELRNDFLTGIEKRLYGYLRMRKDARIQFSVIYNPLMQEGIGTNAFPDPSNNKNIVFIAGPWPTVAGLRTNISHEMMHPVMQQLYSQSVAFKNALSRTESVNRRVTGERWGYDTWFSLFAEETIRCVSSKIESSPQGKFQHSDYITKRLANFETSDISFEAFLIQLLDELKAKEKP